MLILVVLFLLVISNLIIFIIAKVTRGEGRVGNFAQRKLSQFKFNAYIRFFMLCYFDFTFFSVMKIVEGDNTTSMRKMALFFSYVFFVVAIVAPISFFVLVYKK